MSAAPILAGPAPWPPARAATVVLIASICFATSGPLAQIAAPAHPLLIAAGRTSLAAILLAAIAPKGSLRAIAGLAPRDLGRVLVAGALLAAHFGFFLAGLASTSLPAAVTLVSLEPVAVVLAAWGLFGARPKVLEMVGVMVATVGAVVLSQGADGGAHRLQGDLLVLIAVALYGFYIAAARGLATLLPSSAYATLVYASAGVLLSVAALAVRAPLELPPRSLLAIALLGVIPTLGGHTLVQWAAPRVPASVVALVSPGETLGSLAIAAMFLGQRLSPVEAAGAALALTGATFTLLAQRAPRS